MSRIGLETDEKDYFQASFEILKIYIIFVPS